MPVIEALHAAATAIARGVGRLGAIGVIEATHAHVQLVAAPCIGLPRAVARLDAREGADVEHVVATTIEATVFGGSALDTDVAVARRLAFLAVAVDQALHAGPARTERTFRRAILPALALHVGAGRDLRKQLERAPLIQVATQRRRAQKQGPAGRRHPDAPQAHRRSLTVRIARTSAG